MAERRAAAAARRAAARRRRLLCLLAVVLLGAGAGACATIRHDGEKDRTTTTPADGASTATTAKKTSGFEVGLTTFDWEDPSRDTVNGADLSQPVKGRLLLSEVRYPTRHGSPSHETTGAAPASKDGPFPVIFFAHGFDVSPSYYAPLLDYWVKAGFIVVSPVFPDESTAAIEKAGGPESEAARNDESDDLNEPGDVVFVLKKFYAATEPGSGSLLAGLAERDELALAGQSDGGDVVGALEYGSGYDSLRRALPVAPRAVAVLSGEALLGGAANAYSASASSPALLQVQSDADTCNGAQDAADLFSELEGAPVHLFETLQGASHLAPYTDLVAGPDPYLPVVQKVTTEFFEAVLGWQSGGLSLKTVQQSATVPEVSSISSSVGSFPTSPPGGDCSLPGSSPEQG